MAYESKWFQSGASVVVLTMDPDTSGVTWQDVATALNAGEALPATVRLDTYGLPEEGVVLAEYAETCKIESIRLAEHEAAQAMTPATVTLLD